MRVDSGRSRSEPDARAETELPWSGSTGYGVEVGGVSLRHACVNRRVATRYPPPTARGWRPGRRELSGWHMFPDRVASQREAL